MFPWQRKMKRIADLPSDLFFNSTLVAYMLAIAIHFVH